MKLSKIVTQLLVVASAAPSAWAFQPPSTARPAHATRTSSTSRQPQRRCPTTVPPTPSSSSLQTKPSTATTSLSALPIAATAATAAVTSTLASLSSPLGSLAVLAFVILVHEAGHFLAARSLGIRVEEFSVGVGPRILGVRRKRRRTKHGREGNGDEFDFEWIVERDDEEQRVPLSSSKSPSSGSSDDEDNYADEIEFSLRALPLGGYVRFPENYNRTLAYEIDDVVRLAKRQALKLRLQDESIAAWEKVLENVAARSFVANALSLGLLGKWVERRVEGQLRGVEEEVRLLESSEKRQAGSWFDVLPWVNNNNNNNNDENNSILGDAASIGTTTDDALNHLDPKSKLEILQAATTKPEITYSADPDLLQNRPWEQRALVLSGGVIFNILLAFACYFGEVTGGRGLPRPVFDNGAVVSSVVGPESPAFGVLVQGDVIVGVNDMISSAANNGKKGMWASQSEISNVISTIRKTPEGEAVKLTILHGMKDTNDIRTRPQPESVTVAPKRKLDALGQPTGPQSIGVMLAPNYLRTEMIKATDIFDAISKSSLAVYEITSETAKSIFGLLINLLFGKGLPAGTSMSGPIGVISTGSEVVSSRDIATIVAFAASISVNLAVVNSLPLPALDGGQLMFVLAEAAAGRKIDQRLQEGINAGALLVLLCISFGTAVGDVTSIFSR